MADTSDSMRRIAVMEEAMKADEAVSEILGIPRPPHLVGRVICCRALGVTSMLRNLESVSRE